MNRRSEVVDKLRDLEHYLGRLEELARHDLGTLEEDAILSAATERVLQIALQACIDAGEIIIAVEGAERPDTYRQVILTLGKLEVLDQGFAERFAPAAGLRNVLVHLYADVDLERVHRFLQEDLDDLRTFLQSVARYVEGRS